MPPTVSEYVGAGGGPGVAGVWGGAWLVVGVEMDTAVELDVVELDVVGDDVLLVVVPVEVGKLVGVVVADVVGVVAGELFDPLHVGTAGS